MEEYWDVYDQNRVFQNRTIRRGDIFKDGEFYVSCEVWFQNSKGELLVTLRHPSKKAGGLWEFVGGGVLAGESTAEAAVREVKEEIGVTITTEDLSLLDVCRYKRYFMDVYLAKKDLNIQDLVLNSDETIDAKWVSKDELLTLIENKIVVNSVACRYEMLCGKL